MTAQSEELKASSDILTQERSLLHAKVASIHQDRTELDIRLKKEREAWAREKSELIARQDEQQQENARKLSDIQVFTGSNFIKLLRVENVAKQLSASLKLAGYQLQIVLVTW